eukprot:1612393-Pleurochrysis_carterae.AAC.1
MLGSYWGRALNPSVIDLSELCLILGYGNATKGWKGDSFVEDHADIGAGVRGQGRRHNAACACFKVLRGHEPD